VNILFFSIPIYFSFSTKKPIFFILIIIGFLIAEYFIYVYFTSQEYFVDKNGILNMIISVVFLLLFFFRYIKLIFQIKA
jgi:hypothetical protein